jgi:cellulose biosynthesis protein BcsQ
MSPTTINLRAALQNLPEDCKEAAISSFFANHLLAALGFQPGEIHPQYPTGNRSDAVDLAARKTIGDDVFLHTRSNPDLLLELKGRDINLANDSAQYQNTVKQLKRYLFSPNCKTAKWGIITNSRHVQLFRKHGRVIHPATQCLLLDADNIDDIVTLIRKKIENPIKALTVAVYNNKGGVGKTTTTVNLAAILTFLGKRVLAIDFDPNQQDLTSALGICPSEQGLFNALTERNIDLLSTVHFYRFPLKKSNSELRFDVIPADNFLGAQSDRELLQRLKLNKLYQKLESARREYDYILIDSPPNWRLFSRLAVYAADVVLIPTKHNNLFSLENAATAMKKFIFEVQKVKGDGSPIPLPIFFNGEKTTEPQLKVAEAEIDSILQIAKKEGFDLSPYFSPKHPLDDRKLTILEVPGFASIAGSAFSRTPAVYRDRNAHEYYKNLAKEYFLQ